MKYGFNVVAVGIDREGRVVARVVGALARRSVVAAARSQRRPVKGLDRLPVRRLEREMDARHVAVGHVDPELVHVEMPVAFDERVSQAERRQHGPIEALAGFQVLDAQVDMVE